MKFKGWQKTSLIEYPGKISTILFTGSCNFRCPFCYNRDLVLNPKKLPDIIGEEVLTWLRENMNLYHAVVVTGGEPTMNKELPEFLALVKGLGFLVGLETNGTNPGMLERLLKDKVLDFVAMDIKAPLNFREYMKAAGISDKRLFEKVKKSVRIIMENAPEYEFRTTIVPELHQEKDILLIAEQLKGAKRYVLQQFVPKNTLDKKMTKLRPFPEDKLFEIRRKIKKMFDECVVRNV